MLIIVTEPCGCNLFDRNHENPNCTIYKERKAWREIVDKLLKEFKQALNPKSLEL